MTAAAAIEIASGLVGPLKEAFKDAGFAAPNIDFTETESTLSLVVQGARVTGTHNLSQDFISDYWRGKLLFSETSGWTSSDTITVSAILHHQAGDHRPHDNDENKGDAKGVAQLTINSAVETAVTATKGPATKQARHLSNHADSYTGTLSADLKQNRFVNDIVAWTFELTGSHDDHPPVSLLLKPDASTALAGAVKVDLLANEEVRSVANLNVVFEYDSRLTVGEQDVRPGPLLAHSETIVDVETPGRLGLRVKSHHVDGPGLLATVRFHLPEVPRQESYDIACVFVEALSDDGSAMKLGCDDCTIAIAEFGVPTNDTSAEIKTGCLWEDKFYSEGAVVKMNDGKCHRCDHDASGFKWGAGLEC